MKQTNERLCALAQKGDAAALDSLIDMICPKLKYTRLPTTKISKRTSGLPISP